MEQAKRDSPEAIQLLQEKAQALNAEAYNLAQQIAEAGTHHTYLPGDITPLANAIIMLDKRLKLLKSVVNLLTLPNTFE